MDESTTARLELIAAKAKQLALDYKNGKLWAGDLTKGISEISTQIRLIPQE